VKKARNIFLAGLFKKKWQLFLTAGRVRLLKTVPVEMD